MSTREDWLIAAVSALDETFTLGLSDADADVRVSCGYGPRATRRVRLVSVERDSEGSAQVYVSPMLDDAPDVLAALLYGLCEIVAPRRAATRRVRVGFLETVTGAIVPGVTLGDRLTFLAGTLETYPHAHTDPHATRTVQSTRMLKAVCADDHDPYVIRLSRTQADRGMPLCGVCRCHMVLV